MASRSIDPPIPLDGAALAKWQALAVVDMTERRTMALAAWCAAFGRWVAAEEWLASPDHGPVMTIRDDKGNIKSHGPAPQLRIAEQALKEMARLQQAAQVR